LAEPESTIHQLLRDCDLSFADQNDPSAIADAFEELLIRWETGVWEVSEKSREGALKYRIENVNTQLDNILTSLIPNAF
jgi:hypothetical protein